MLAPSAASYLRTGALYVVQTVKSLSRFVFSLVLEKKPMRSFRQAHGEGERSHGQASLKSGTRGGKKGTSFQHGPSVVAELALDLLC
jgi:hypothetical protein